MMPATTEPGAKPPPGAPGGPPLLLWVGLAVVLGFGLRMFTIDPRFVPFAIGVCTAAMVVLLLRLVLNDPEPPKGSLSKSGSRSRPLKKALPKVDSSKESGSRLAALARRNGRR